MGSAAAAAGVPAAATAAAAASFLQRLVANAEADVATVVRKGGTDPAQAVAMQLDADVSDADAADAVVAAAPERGAMEASSSRSQCVPTTRAALGLNTGVWEEDKTAVGQILQSVLVGCAELTVGNKPDCTYYGTRQTWNPRACFEKAQESAFLQLPTAVSFTCSSLFTCWGSMFDMRTVIRTTGWTAETQS